MPADYDGDGATDIAVWRPSSATWWILTSASGFRPSQRLAIQWGNPQSTDVPVPADYDGDGQADIAVWRPRDGNWWILLSTEDYSPAARLRIQWGIGTQNDVPVPADYDGDGRADLGVWRPATGVWYLRTSSTEYAATWNMPYGTAGDIPLLAGWSAVKRYLGQ